VSSQRDFTLTLDTLLNPKIIIEILSDSTEAYDRGKKFELYRSLESLSEYVLISTPGSVGGTLHPGAERHVDL
jgi:Uma2 family endonuclease